MTYDKIIYYLGSNIVDSIKNLDADQLKARKHSLISDMNIDAVIQDKSTLFKRTVELEFINNLLK